MTKDEWIARCAARFVAEAGLEAERAREFAEACFENDGTGYFSDDPEGSADEDMSCW
jgi:hypothetical protein